MIKLENDSLTFAFPDIALQLTALVEQHIEQLRPKFILPANRDSLVSDLRDQLSVSSDLELASNDDRRLYETAKSLTEADVEKAFRERAYEVAGLHDESFASVSIEFQRTLRIPDDGRTYPLPAGLGLFPLRAVDDFAATTPASWVQRGGVLMPMYQSEALWVRFLARYPFAVKIAAGKINAISGEPWSSELQRQPQNYVVIPRQPWLDGFAVGEGVIRQFVAMPLGAGYSVEEQLTGLAEVGGMQLQAYPMSAKTYFRKELIRLLPSKLSDLLTRLFAAHLVESRRFLYRCLEAASMGLGAGGKMRQEIYKDPYPFDGWDQTQTRRCFVHLCNSLVWRQITGTNPPHPPLTGKEYKQAGIPWFDYYRDDQKPLKGSKRLAGVKSVAQLGKEKKGQPLPENTSITPDLIVQHGNTRRPGEIREFLDTP